MSALTPGRQARALYEYKARAADELSFERNDLIEVIRADDDDDGWYHGRLGARHGLFPNNYVTLLPPRPQTPEASHLPDYVQPSDFDKLYKLVGSLGRGRFSQVRRATQRASGTSFAVKMMDLHDAELGASPADSEREVLSEVAVLQGLNHKGIVKLVETFKWFDKYYLVMEDLKGGDLFDRIEQQGPFSEADAGPLLQQTAAAVNYLHERLLVHRDIKPDNLVFATRESSSVRSVVPPRCPPQACEQPRGFARR